MSVCTVAPSRVAGRIRAPPSKSYTHRALVAGFLSGHRFRVVNPLDSDDTRATGGALRALGASVVRSGPTWTLRPLARRRGRRTIRVECGESGTTLRFATVLAALGDRRVRFSGRGRLGKRPMGPLLGALRSLGARVRPGRGRLPFTIHGPIHGGHVRLDASESSQFASALLLGLPTRSEPSWITLVGRVVSEPYLEATVAVLRSFGVAVTRRGREFHIPAGQRFRGATFAVPGDASSAAYLWVAGALAGGAVEVAGVPSRWPQADRAVLSLLSGAGADVRVRPRSTTVAPGRLRPFSVDLTASPDLYPLAGVLAAAIPGTSRLRGALHVVHKESDRRTETARLASALGARTRSTGGGLSITGRGPLRAIDLPGLSDHRVVMSAAVGALAASGPSRIGRAEAVEKSFPGFWDALRRLGAEVSCS